MEKITGVIEKIVYSDEEKGFSIMKVYSPEYKSQITFVGNIYQVDVGTEISAEGKWTENKKFGSQFSVQTWEEVLPADIKGIERYLSSGLIKGIGPKIAKKIIETFGTESLNIIENEPQRLMEIPKLGVKKAETIAKSWHEQRDIKSLMMFLSNIGVSTSLSHKIFKVYKNDAIAKIRQNPYGLIDDVYGIGFKTADTIAMKIGADKESFQRCRAGIFYVLENIAANEGHCYLPKNELIEKSSKILEIDNGKIAATYDYLICHEELIAEDKTKVYLPCFYHAEIGIANKIKEILNSSLFAKFAAKRLNAEMEKAEAENKIKYDDFQKEAIKKAVNSNFSVITGGAGVGKTTVTKAIIDIFTNLGRKVVLAAPTGRAAKRMSEVTGKEAKTIHRLLEFNNDGKFTKNSENKIDADVLIVDEASMIDVILMNNLLKATLINTSIILIGDVNQLPSVGAGNVLRDIINSGAVPVIKLTKIYRQENMSNIIINSHKINQGEMPDLKVRKNSDFFFIEENDEEKCANLILELCEKRLPKYYKVNPVADIQVLAPMKKGTLGTDNLNNLLQEKLNKSKISLKYGNCEYRLGDKVMQIKNNYDKDVFNGDIGKILFINETLETLEVDFDSKIVEYDISELDEITLAYACTIHKSQGAEYPIIIIPMAKSHYIMLKQNLLYTGITRAKKICVLVGQKDAIFRAVKNNDSKKRYTLLKDRLV